MCCGVTTNGFVANSKIPVPNFAVCNKKPVNGRAMAEDITGVLDGADKDKTKISYDVRPDYFECFPAPPPPHPVNPPVPDPAKAPLGKSCKLATDCAGTANSGWCCGMGTKGYVLDGWGKDKTDIQGPNIVMCNKDIL